MEGGGRAAWCGCGGGGGCYTCPLRTTRSDVVLIIVTTTAISTPSQRTETMTCRSPQGNSSSNNNRGACGDANVCRYECVCGRHQSRAKLSGKRLRQSFLQLDDLKADAQLEAAISATIKSNAYAINTSRGFTSTAGAAGAAGGASGVAGGADGGGAAGGAGAVAIVVKSAAKAPTLNCDSAPDPAARRKRRREDSYPQPQAQTQTHQNPQPHPPAERRRSTSGSTSGISTNGVSSARSFRNEGGPLIGVPTDQAAAMSGRWDVSMSYNYSRVPCNTLTTTHRCCFVCCCSPNTGACLMFV